MVRPYVVRISLRTCSCTSVSDAARSSTVSVRVYLPGRALHARTINTAGPGNLHNGSVSSCLFQPVPDSQCMPVRASDGGHVTLPQHHTTQLANALKCTVEAAHHSTPNIGGAGPATGKQGHFPDPHNGWTCCVRPHLIRRSGMMKEPRSGRTKLVPRSCGEAGPEIDARTCKPS